MGPGSVVRSGLSVTCRARRAGDGVRVVVYGTWPPSSTESSTGLTDAPLGSTASIGVCPTATPFRSTVAPPGTDSSCRWTGWELTTGRAGPVEGPGAGTGGASEPIPRTSAAAAPNPKHARRSTISPAAETAAVRSRRPVRRGGFRGAGAGAGPTSRSGTIVSVVLSDGRTSASEEDLLSKVCRSVIFRTRSVGSSSGAGGPHVASPLHTRSRSSQSGIRRAGSVMRQASIAVSIRSGQSGRICVTGWYTPVVIASRIGSSADPGNACRPVTSS
jgi:hypothetical protein